MSSSGDPVVELIDIGKEFPGPPQVSVLRGVNLRLDVGDYAAIVGPSGSGKSTLLNLIGLLDAPTTGIYKLDGSDVGLLNETQRTALRGHKIGFVFQEFHLLSHRTALENVALGSLYTGPPAARRNELAAEALRQVGLSHRLHALPNVMSGGERQRVAIARALMQAPSLLLCDEPTGNLDSRTAGQILDLFDELHSQGATLLIITHDATTAARANRNLDMRDGLLSEMDHVDG